jgi:sugar phosphate isomerase/epimerase
MSTRRSFFKNAALGLAATTIPASVIRSNRPTPENGQAKKALTLGMAGYTFRYFNIDDSIAMMQRVGITQTTLKDFHLPYDSTPEKITGVMNKFKNAGINVYGLGVIYMKTNEEVDKMFAYAKNAGVDLIVGVPTYELLNYTEQKVKEYNIPIAIHNHGPEDKLYPSPKDVYDRIKNMDKRVGLCVDIGHAFRAGADPAKAILEYAPRVFDMHIKDVTAPEKDAKVIEVGRGAINFPALIKALNKINYTGKCSFEFEKDMKDPLPGIAESVGYFKGVMNSFNAI